MNKQEKYKLAIANNKFKLENLNLLQKSILRYIYNLIPDDNNFIQNFSKFLKYDLSKNDIIVAKKDFITSRVKINLYDYSYQLQRKIKEELKSMSINYSDLKYIQNIYNDRWNFLIIDEIKKKNYFINENNLSKSFSRKQKQIEYEFLKKYNISKDFIDEKMLEKITKIPKYYISEEIERTLVEFIYNYIYKENVYTDEEHNSIIKFIDDDVIKDVIETTMLLLKLNIEYEDILFLYSSYSIFIVDEILEKNFQIKISSIENIISIYKKNINTENTNYFQNRINTIIYSLKI